MNEARTKGYILYVYDTLEKDIKQVSSSLRVWGLTIEKHGCYLE
jgi:hypothetical protein